MNNILTGCFMRLCFGGNVLAFSLVQFRHRPPITQIVSTNMRLAHLPVNLPDVTGTLLNFIVAALNAIPIPTDFNDGFYEKLIVWKVDEHIPSRIDFQQLSNELQDRHIPLVFVTEVTPDFQTWDLYRETARNTGGEYLLLPSDPTALRRAISSAINGEDTLRQAFLHLRTQQNAAATSRPTDANEQTQGADNDLIFPFD
ncbi:unnamed protein product [Adineta ricciae]|uniref:Uncharacterized protein n=1 Tax=Adineta ricciae TaxID=249248 RepID=A0A816C4Z0_ADIRI|nr:unnamed protein product [Adineta ricciae]